MNALTAYHASLADAGWRFVRHTKGSHSLWQCPCGEHRITIPGSPGDYRALRNSAAQVRKCPRSKDFRRSA